jgi:6-pyruvoyltetrahydropterin/6-carboxytetrahydropterin synthase
MTYRIRKSFTFEAAHQLESAYTEACSDCIHGHSYTVEMFLTSEALDKDDMVIDFGKLKKFKKKVMKQWDHGLILHEAKKKHIQPLIDAGVLKKSKVSFYNFNPTAEFMACRLASLLQLFLQKNWSKKHSHVKVEKVRVHETASGWAESCGTTYAEASYE